MLLAKHLDLHSHFEKRERLCKVHYTELISGLELGVFDFEIEPLLMTFRICVNLTKQVVLLGHYLLSSTLHVHVSMVYRVSFNTFEVATLYG